MKALKTLVAIALSAAGLGSAVTLGVVANNDNVQKANAAVWTGGEKIYFQPNSNWNQANARFAVYAYGTGDTWFNLTRCDESADVYTAEVPSGSWNGIIFCRMNPSTTENNWDNKWNQTSDVTTYGASKLFTMNSGSWDTGSWYTTKDCVVAGSFNGWSTSANDMVFDPSTYQYETTFTTTEDAATFKVVFDGTWKGVSKVDTNVNSNYIDLSQGGDNNIGAKIAGDYEIYYKPYSDKIWVQISSDTEANNYADTFLGAMTCDSTGATAPSFSTSWSDLKTAFNALTVGAKGKFTTASANPNGSKIEQTVARYDYIVGKYGTQTYEDFMGRSPASLNSSRITTYNPTNGSAIIIATIVSIVTLSAAGTFFLLRKKRKEQ